LDNKNKEKSEYLKCGASGDIKIILNLLILAAGSYSAYITIINESRDNNILDEYKKNSLKAKEENESKIIENFNEENFNIKKLSIFGLDELLNSFESLSGISKLLFIVTLSNTIILGCIFSIIFNLYGNYLLDRFQLEAKYPKIALFINYRRKVSKYYLISKILIIILICLINLILSISILSL